MNKKPLATENTERTEINPHILCALCGLNQGF